MSRLRQRMPPLRTAALGCFAILFAAFGCARSPEAVQRDYVAENLQPVPPEANPDAPARAVNGLRRDMRVHVRVSSAYRRENREWESRVRRTLARASAYTQAEFGVSLDVVQLDKWDRDDSVTEPLEDSLVALEALDPGKDCDLVVGFVGADAYSTQYHAVGEARAPGRHVVLRGTESIAYHKWQARQLDELPDEERDRLYEAIKAHKEVLVLIHEWAHTLGAPHDTGLSFVMSPTYSPRAHRMSPATIEVVRRGLAARLADTPEARKQAESEQQKIIASHRAELEPESRASVEKALDREAKVPARPVNRGPELSRNDQWELNAVSNLHNQRRYAEAAERLRPLAERYPAHPQVQVLHCQVQSGALPGEGATAGACQRACELDSGFMACAMAVQALRMANRRADLPAAVATLRQRAKDLRDPADLALVAQVLLGAGWLAVAEETLAGMGLVPAAMQVRAEIERRRRWTGLPARELPPERESDYLDVLARSTAKGRERDANLSNDSQPFLQVPGLMVVAAEQLAVHGKLAQARQDCGKALAKYPHCLTGLYLLARIEVAEKHWPEAVTQLRAVVGSDPSYEPAWHDLAKALVGAGQAAQVPELQGKFRTQFGRELEQP
ncbi:MAG: hypothetical protein HY902_07265 [Deltaproteobacteria bacterium]|nr:hypothetical protein [Deltaproteobacteria bacterium]